LRHGYQERKGGEIYLYAYKYSYDIDKLVNGTPTFQEVAIKKQSVPPRAPCNITTSYSPNNPAVYYNDPNLP